MPVLETIGTGDPSMELPNGPAAARFPSHTYVPIPSGTHQTRDDDHPAAGWCVQAMMREFLAEPRTPARDHGCDWTTYQPLGGFPTMAAELSAAQSPQLTPAESAMVAAAFATAVDATIPLHAVEPPPTGYTQPGVRAGTATHDNGTGAVTLHGVRFVEDVTIDGTVSVDLEHRATAALDVTSPSGPVQRVTLHWRFLDASPWRR